ncbi:MAG: hypothetical protein LAO05_08050 [Acidobacteriia bacterium]|nr:hypothetical protein [Terriglobia bacterium]
MDDPPPSPSTGHTSNPLDPDRAESASEPTDSSALGFEGTGAALVGSARAIAAGEAVRALAHVARSFVLYDAANERIRAFLEDARIKVEHFLSTHGEMQLEVRPWDIVLGGEVVYTDKDRERSLSFRLYRDGVRRLTLHSDLEWPELVLLIGILSIRYKGVRTQEDDVVTLLWRADFKHIDVGAVEGVIASEDEAVDVPSPVGKAAGGPRDAMQAMIFGAPYAFSYPWPNLTERAMVERRPVPPSLLARITEEEGVESLPEESLQLVRGLLTGLSDPHDPLTFEDVAPVLREIRGFLVGERCFDALLEMARLVQAVSGLDEESHKELLAASVDEEVVRRFMVAVDPTETLAPPALIELMSLTPGDHLATLLDLFTSSARHRSSPVVSQLLESQLRGRAARLVDHLSGANAAVVIELFRLLARADPGGAIDVAVVLLARPEMEAQVEAAKFLSTVEYSGKVGRAMVGALGSTFLEVRTQAMAVLVRRREGRAFETLVDRTRRNATELSMAEAKVTGEALARLDQEKARTVFKEWVRPSGLLGRLSPAQSILRWVAVAGLPLLPGKESEDLLQWLSHHAGDELAQQCGVALAELREQQGKHRA